MNESCCPTCGHPVAQPDAYGLSPVERRIFRIIHRAGQAGVSRDSILERAYGRDGGPETLNVISVHVAGINRKLAAHALRVASSRGPYATYRVLADV